MTNNQTTTGPARTGMSFNHPGWKNINTLPRKTIIATMVSYVLNERRYRHQQAIKLGGQA
ncbi:TPA: hypothetical protein ACN36B_004392 [Vibrio parahaemolyticus]